ncbi:MAG: hypothetical protein R2879_03575 [Saprospiraceae bacterium]
MSNSNFFDEGDFFILEDYFYPKMQNRPLPSRIFAFTMAILVMVSASGLLIDMHFCKGEFKTFAFFKKAKNCHEIANGNTKCLHHKKNKEKVGKKNGLKRKDCCQNKSFYSIFDIQNTQAQQPEAFNLDNLRNYIFLDTYHLAELQIECRPVTLLKRIKPPPLGIKKNILFQTFLC